MNFGMMGGGAGPQAQLQGQPRDQILQRIRQMAVPGGWQSSVRPEERADKIVELATSTRMAKGDIPLIDAVRSSMGFETDRFLKASSKDHYLSDLQGKLALLRDARQKLVMNTMQQGHPMSQPQMGMMPQTPMPVGSVGAQNQPQFSQSFPPQLQHPMQATPIPGYPPNSMSRPMDGVSMTGGLQQPLQQQRPPGMPQGNVAMTQAENQQINVIAQKMMAGAPKETIDKIRAHFLTMPPEERAEFERRRLDPVIAHFRRQAAQHVARQKQMRMMQGQNLQKPDQGLGGAVTAAGQPPNMLPHTDPAQMPGGQSQAGVMPGNQEFDFSHLAGQQADGFRSQDAGLLVVPASSNPGINQRAPGMAQMGGPPQPGQMPQQGLGVNAQNQAAMMHRQAQFADAQRAQRENAIRMSHMQAQAQAQARAQQAKSQAQPPPSTPAQGQPQGAQTPLRGQLGGLHMNQPPQQSPGMPNLTRPMVPPGQPAGTPQPRPQAPQMTPQGSQQMDPRIAMHQAQQRAAAAAAAAAAKGPNSAVMVRAAQLNVPQNIRHRMAQLPEEQAKALLERYIQQVNGGNLNPQQGFPGAQFQMPPGGMQMNGQTAQPQPNMTPFGVMGMPGAGQGMPQGGPNMNAMGQMPQGNLRMQQELLRRPLPPEVLREMDQKPFPPQILNASNNKASVPDDVKTWGQLKAWVRNNPTRVIDFGVEKALALQRLHYYNDPTSNANPVAVPDGRPNPAPFQFPQFVGQPAQGQPIMMPGISPGQMQLPMGAQPQRAGIPNIQPTAQDIQTARMKFGPRAQNLTDDQLRHFLTQQRLSVLRGNQQSAMNRVPQPPQQRPQGQPPQQQGPIGQPQPPQQPPQMPAAPPNARVAKPPQANEKPAAQPAPARAASGTPKPQKGVKRQNDDVMEVSDPNRPPSQPAQAPPMQQTKSRQRMEPTPDQVAALTPQQRAAFEARQRTEMMQRTQEKGPQVAAPLPNAAAGDLQAEQRFNAIFKEVVSSIAKRPPVDLPPPVRQELETKIRSSVKVISKLDKALPPFFKRFGNENVTRQLIQLRLLIAQQLNKEGQPVERFTITPQEFDIIMGKITSFLSQLMARLAQPQAGPQPLGPSGAQQGQLQPVPETQQLPEPAPLNAGNLKAVQEQQAALRQQQQKAPAGRRGQQQKPPAAPTEAKPPFQIGPDGVPAYASPGLTPEKLKLPPKKKPKTTQTNAGTTPTPAQTAPAAPTPPKAAEVPAPAPVPEPKQAAEAAKPAPEPQPLFKCAYADCDSKGFPSQFELDRHKNEVHVKIDDPIQFFLDSMGGAFNLNPDGTSKEVKQDGTAQPQDAKAAPLVKTQSAPGRAGETPTTKPDASTPAGAASTPMTRVPTQSGAKGSPSTNLLRTPQTGAKAQTPRSTPSKPAKDSVEKADQAASAVVEATPAAPATDPTDALLSPWANSFVSQDTLAQCFEGLDNFGSLFGNMSEASSLFNIDTPIDTPPISPPSPRASDKSNGDSDMVDAPPQVGDSLPPGVDPFLLLDVAQLEDMQTLGVLAEDELFDFGAASSADAFFDKDNAPKIASMEWDDVIGPKAGLEEEADIPGFTAGEMGLFEFFQEPEVTA